MSDRDVSQLSMQDLFRIEAEAQTQVLTAGLLALERDPSAKAELDACMRAAHSMKGAARVIDAVAGVALAHAMEDFLVAAQIGRLELTQAQIDLLLRGVDLMMAIARSPDIATPGRTLGDVDAYVVQLREALDGTGVGAPPARTEAVTAPSRKRSPASRQPRVKAPGEAASPAAPAAPAAARTPAPIRSSAPAVAQPSALPDPALGPTATIAPPPAAATPSTTDRGLRVTVDNLNRLLGLASESLVGSRWLKPFGQSLLRLKRLQHDAAKAVDRLRDALPPAAFDERVNVALADAQRRISECSNMLTDRLAALEESDRHGTSLAYRLYNQTLACRMRPFADTALTFPRMVRDLAKQLGKQVRLEIVGADTDVDRDILEKLDAPIGHLLRNAVDHGIETPDERIAAGKSPEGVIRLEARHSAGALQIVVSDDGTGIDVERVRAKIIERKLASAETARRLSDPELLEFLYLPGFSLASHVTPVSGRGVGLDAVRDMLKNVRGIARTTTDLGRGSRFHLQLPLTLSVVRGLVVEIGGEPYAFPLASIFRALSLPKSKVNVLEGRQHFDLDGEPVGLVLAAEVLGGAGEPTADSLSVVVIGERQSRHALVVGKLVGSRELVVHPLDARFGKIKDVAAAALLEDGSPVLIVDVDDMIRSVEKLAEADRLSRVDGQTTVASKARKRVLVIDDSLTVRELERKLLDRQGYDVAVAVDGMDAWNVLRSQPFDLVLTDVDMPRMDGIELVKLIKSDPKLKSLPVMVVSYKDRDEDRRRGLDAGADYYLAKGSFQDDALIQAVGNLIGEAA